MTSFLPIIEAFIALGLTMIVLTTGVSSLAGTWQRLTRSRARGLRALLRCVWLLSVKGQAKACGVSTTLDGEEALCRFVGEMSLLPDKLAEINAQGGPAAQDAAFRRSLPDLAPGASEDAVLPIWSSLANSLDNLSDDEFKTRFGASTVGTAIRAKGETTYNESLAAIHAQFVAHGHAATETFARDARWQSTVFAALLVLAANIDAFNLLETYLANPTLTAAIIQKYEKVATNAAPAAGQAAAAPDATRSETLKAWADIETALKSAPSAETEKVQKAAADAKALVVASLDARDAARAVVADATSNFPVGWDRYPGCTRPESDPRCAGLAARSKNATGDTFDNAEQAWQNDRPRLLRWAAGLVLAVVMLGLGAPFWIQTVDGLLRARDMARGGNKPGDGSKPTPPAMAGGT